MSSRNLALLPAWDALSTLGDRIIYYSEMVSKVVARIRGWHSKIVRYGDRITLIKHVLQSLPIHILSTATPTNTTMKQISAFFADFFLGLER